MQEISARIEKDIALFKDSLEKLKSVELSDKEKKVVALATSYADDAKAWFAKEDFYTAFASISYAHGLLDALINIRT